MSWIDGRPRWASSMVGTVVTRSSSMIRGLVSATRPRTITPAGRRPPGSDPAFLAAGTAAPVVGTVELVTRQPRASPRHRWYRLSRLYRLPRPACPGPPCTIPAVPPPGHDDPAP